jgi:hypothetical protein
VENRLAERGRRLSDWKSHERMTSRRSFRTVLLVTASNFDTHNDTFRKLMGNGLSYVVPRFQRDYSWETEQWEELWADILATVPPGVEPAHYMGYLVLRATSGKSFEIIDGQQRLTTLSIIVLAALKHLERLATAATTPEVAEQTRQRQRRIRETYLGGQDPVTLLVQPKLTLNRNNAEYFGHYLVPLGALPRRGVRASNTLLRRAFEWFDERLGHLVSGWSEPDVELARFVEDLADRVFFTVITVTDNLNAYRVFETLNARGLRLSPTDLLKNYLFQTLSSPSEATHELDALEERWEGLVSRLGDDDFSHFVRVHWNSRHSFVRQAELFRRVRNDVRTREQVFELLRALEADLDAYLDLTEPESGEATGDFKNHARTLKLFQIRQPLPLLLAARRTLARHDFETLLRAVVVISFRYNVIGGLSPGEQEAVYARVALAIAEGRSSRLADIIKSLKPIYPNDDQFREAFAEKTLTSGQGRNSRIVKYVLCELESRLASKPVDWANEKITVEHILPKEDVAGWVGFRDQEAPTWVHRLGNLTLLSASRNSQLGNVSWAEKREAYEKSEFALTRQIAQDNSEWTPTELVARQRSLAREAVAHWRVNQLDP